MSPDRPSWRRRRQRPDPETAPEVVVEEMETATQRLREQAWKINATTRTPLIPEEALHTDAETPAAAPGSATGPDS